MSCTPLNHSAIFQLDCSRIVLELEMCDYFVVTNKQALIVWSSGVHTGVTPDTRAA